MPIRVGQLVWNGGSSGIVVSVEKDGTCAIQRDELLDKDVARANIRVHPDGAPLMVGQPVKARTGKPKCGEVMDVNQDWSYNVRYDDGSVELGVRRYNLGTCTLDSVVALSLSQNKGVGLAGAGGLALASELASLFPNLRSLELDSCGVGDEGADELTKLISANRLHSLQSLSIEGSPTRLTDKSVLPLRRAWKAVAKREAQLKLPATGKPHH
eukprot:CAMPEP_0177747148 /NCGR_PEP_ID=MMETSP0484_2-20121128/31245_1 /TAXON_ID=354590 /ORGANISM="Rhodomonas lens, Strain RHODO" /LENGTH=212 /DNA_ID=CAMNT_0019261939 /DNA_START=3 /DNA_END=641 /DNA_ORIENTATION=+